MGRQKMMNNVIIIIKDFVKKFHFPCSTSAFKIWKTLTIAINSTNNVMALLIIQLHRPTSAIVKDEIIVKL